MITGERLRIAFKNAGVSLAKAAEYIGISQTSLYNILKKDSFELEYLKKSAELLGVTVSSLLDDASPNTPTTPVTQTGDFNQSGNHNTQKVKGNKASAQDQAPSQDLAAALAACQRELEVTRALVAAKDDTITLLRARYDRPN